MDTKEEARLLALYRFEDEYYEAGLALVAGIDEAGRGPLAGPVAAAAVILPPHALIERLNDSKKLSAKRREELAAIIKETALAWSIATVEAAEIDAINILQATKKAMWLAVQGLSLRPQQLLIDGRDTLPQQEIAQRAIIGGDRLSANIAAAGILAKTHRDALMLQYHEQYPQYGFDKHKGYGTEAHRAAIKQYGSSPIHRLTFQVK